MRIKDSYMGQDPNTKTAPFGRPRSTDHLHWKDDPNDYPAQFVNYHAYLVRFEDLSYPILTFHFLNVADAGDIPGSFPIDLTDGKLVLENLPSTIARDGNKQPINGAPKLGEECGFLFIDQRELDKRAQNDPTLMSMKAAADASGGGTGKYPKSA